MQRTIFNDGIEVDQSDLNNTESSKIDEILLTRQSNTRFGVIEGLELVILNNTISVSVGKLSFPNGEIGQVDTALSNIVGASFDSGRSSFFGLRLTEVTSNPKPHEADPITVDTRATHKLVGEFFVAATATAGARTTAFNNAVLAQTNDRNFVLLGELVGNGTGFSIVKNRPLPRSKGGFEPFSNNTKNSAQIGALNNIYVNPSNDQSPINSAQDEFHRSLIGSGNPTQNNPHGLTITDIGGDQFIQEHQTDAHTNGILGFDPITSNVTPTGGSLAFSTADSPSNSVTVAPILASEALLVAGTKFTASTLGSSTTISFSALAAGQYYIVVKGGTDNTSGLTVLAIAKATMDALAPSINGNPGDLNNAVELSSVTNQLEKKFFIVGLVFWNGSNAFRQIAEIGQFSIPSPGGDLIFSPNFAPQDPFYIPAGSKTLDLRRYGTISTENVQRRSIRLDRLVKPVVPGSTFTLHAGLDTAGNVVSGQGYHASAAAGAAGDNVFLRHLTNFDAWDLFGHRGQRGYLQHAASVHDGTNTDNPSYYGFQSNIDKWKQDNLTMTILKFANLQGFDSAQRTLGDAVGTSNGSNTGGQYAFIRNGYISNICCRLGDKVNGGSQSVTVNLILNGATNALATFTSSDGNGAVKYIPGPFTFIGSVATPGTIGITSAATAAANAHNLTVTMEFHYNG